MQDNSEGSKILTGIGKYIESYVSKYGIYELTEIQEMASLKILEGKDCLLIAPTGTGKTLAVMLPIFSLWASEKHKPISILYITPLRSLNRDLLGRLKWWASELDMEIAVRHGDTTQYERTKQAEIPSDILITTPETLQSMLTGSLMRKNLANVRFVVVDEAHELINSKRGAQLSIGLERLRRVSGDFQTVGLSATIGNPSEVASFLNGSRPCEIIKSVDTRKSNIVVETVGAIEADTKTASDLLVGIDTAARLRRIHETLGNRKSVLVFTNTREFAEILSSRLKKFSGHRVETHHGSLAKDVRIEFEKGFKEEAIKALVATSSLELGIDIGSVETVIQYQSPRQVSKLVQRVGRSGHSVGKTPEGIILATGVDDAIESAAIAKLAAEGRIENPKPHKLALDVMAHQIVGMAIESYAITMKEIYDTITRSYLYKGLALETFYSVCRQLQQLGHIYINQDSIVRRKSGWQYYFENLSTIPSVRQYRIFDLVSRKHVGTLDEEFIALHGSPGTTFVVKGQSWRITDVDNDVVNVELTDDMEAAIPAWEGELIPVPNEVAKEVLKIKSKVSSMIAGGIDTAEIHKFLMDEYPVDAETAKLIVRSVKKQSKDFLFTTDSIVVETFGDMVVIHAHYGSLVNDTLGRALAFWLTNKTGAATLKTDPYRITIRCQKGAAPYVTEFFSSVSEKELGRLLRKNIHRSDLFKWRFFYNAKRFGAIAKTADLGKVPLGKIMETYESTPIYEETMREILLEKQDVPMACRVLEDINSGKIAIRKAEGPSFFGKLALDKSFGEVIGSERPEAEILNIFKERIRESRIRLICMNCGKWTWLGSVKEAPEKPKCQKCKAMLVTVTSERDRITEQAVLRKSLGKTLDAGQTKLFEDALKIADLVMVGGKNAIIALAGRGVGYATTSRILSKYHSDEDDLYRDILAAERQYFRTKRFWK